jgi:ATP-dependent Clp protease adaptor protein ClpS
MAFRVGAAGGFAGQFAAMKAFGNMSEQEKNDLHRDGDGHDLAVAEARPKLKRPPLYRVILINDDYTPMEFVVEVLESIFSMERPKATRVMLEVHTKGKGICGVYNFEIAETKVAQVMSIAQQQQHPLLCTMEES